MICRFILFSRLYIILKKKQTKKKKLGLDKINCQKLLEIFASSPHPLYIAMPSENANHLLMLYFSFPTFL